MWGAKVDREIYQDSFVRNQAKKNYREAFRSGYKGVDQNVKLYTTDWGFKVKDIKVPILLWYGEDDKNVTLAMGKYYQSQIKNSKLKIYSGEGHLISRTHIEEILKT